MILRLPVLRETATSTSGRMRVTLRNVLIQPQDVGVLRRWLLTHLRQGSTDRRSGDAPLTIADLVGTAGFARLRSGLAWFVVRNRSAVGLSADDVTLWIETSGLRGVRTSVTQMAREFGLSARQAHRRIRRVDSEVARLLGSLDGRLEDWAPSGATGPMTAVEMIAALRADSLSTVDPERALDAVTMYARNRLRKGDHTENRYLSDAKDKRYRDAASVGAWLATLAEDPPLPSMMPAERALLAVHDGVELPSDPHAALADINHAIDVQQREALPLLLAHAARLIPDASAAGTDAWLTYLRLRHHAAMESEHASALRYARALQVDAARLAPTGAADTRVRIGLGGRGHTLQVFGHYREATACYLQLIRHSLLFPPSEEPEWWIIHDAYGQVAYTQALSGGDLGLAKSALRKANALADTLGDDRDIQFGQTRRMLEIELAATIQRDDLSIPTFQRASELSIERRFAGFLAAADRMTQSNRLLETQDIMLLYAVATRDAGLAHQARATFQHVTDTVGGFANLTDRFNARLRWAAQLSPRFEGIAAVSGPADALREPGAIPRRQTGLLVRPQPRKRHDRG